MTTFEDFWPIARGMRGRCNNPPARARRAWEAAIKAGADPREIIAGLKGYIGAMREMDTEEKYILQAATFINGGSWEQYLNEPEAKAYLAKPKLEIVK